MNEDKWKGGWNMIKGQLKQKYGQLTENDLVYVEGKEEELLGRIQRRTGETKEAIKEYIDSL